MTSNSHENWRPWRDGAYEVSDLGRVRRAKPGRKTQVGRVLTNTRMSIGYLCVRPVVGGKNVQMYVHTMVAECFIGPRPSGYEINHIDGNKTNACASNLEYVTHIGNMAHAAASGLTPRGERHGNAKLSDADAALLRARRRAGEPLRALAREYGIAPSTASQIANERRRASV